MKKNILLTIGLFVFFAGLSIFLSWRGGPSNVPIPNIDSGTFLHAGQSILQGGTPYIDFWDHKSPLLFYINALGLLLNHNSWWGVWILDVIWGAMTGLVIFLLLKKKGTFPAFLISTSALMVFRFTFPTWNYPEMYYLIFVFLGLLFFQKARQSNKIGWNGFWIGLSFSGAFMLRQNLISVWIVIAIIFLFEWLFEPKKYKLVDFLPIIGGAALGSLIILSQILIKGAFNEYWDAAFRFNFAYTDVPMSDRLFALKAFIKNMLSYSKFTATALILWPISFIAFIFQSDLIKSVHNLVNQRLIKLLCITLMVCGFVVLILVSLSPKNMIIETIIAFGLVSISIWYLLLSSKHIVKPLSLWINKLGLQLSILDKAVVLLFALDIFMITLSGREDTRYYGMIIPSSVLLLSWGFSIYEFWVEKIVSSKYRSIVHVAFYGCIIFFMIILPTVNLTKVLSTPFPLVDSGDIQTLETANYIRENTEIDDYVWIWGHGAKLYFYTDRQSPTRFTYTIPLYKPGYCRPEIVDEIIKDLQIHPPKIFIDTYNWRDRHYLVLPSRKNIYSAEDLIYVMSQNSCMDVLLPLFSYIDEHYVPYESIGNLKWDVYVPRTVD
jgi:hypothetical protein